MMIKPDFTINDIMSITRNILICALLIISVSGCSTVQLVVSFSPEMQQLRTGEQAFESGDFDTAETIFLEVATSDTSVQTKNTALYNLACTRIITADNFDKFIQAINLFNDWHSTYPATVYMENPNLIVSALTSRSLVFHLDRLILEQEHESALSQSSNNQKIISRQRMEIQNLKHNLQTLQHQIDELEVIDQQLQEKKKPL